MLCIKTKIRYIILNNIVIIKFFVLAEKRRVRYWSKTGMLSLPLVLLVIMIVHMKSNYIIQLFVTIAGCLVINTNNTIIVFLYNGGPDDVCRRFGIFNPNA